VDETEAPGTETPGETFYRSLQLRSGEETAASIREIGAGAEAYEIDLAEPESIPELFDRAEHIFGRVDVLINNAAHCEADTFLPQNLVAPDGRTPDLVSMSSITPLSHDEHFAVNSRAVALMMAEFARRHTARGARWGRIVNVSTDGASGFAGEVSYGASKHALESYTRAAASELGSYGITVNVVSLGPIQTGWISPEMSETIAAQTPLRRVGRPEDVAGVMVFLASDQARWITGQLLYVGGGWRMPL
jgi:3-oxoacyl-[acyl-carrier protein] reductase